MLTKNAQEHTFKARPGPKNFFKLRRENRSVRGKSCQKIHCHYVQLAPRPYRLNSDVHQNPTHI